MGCLDWMWNEEGGWKVRLVVFDFDFWPYSPYLSESSILEYYQCNAMQCNACWCCLLNIRIGRNFFFENPSLVF